MAGDSKEVRSSIVELRQYTLHPGTRETLVKLFDREFVESQEDCGMSVIGQFRDLDRPDRFVWLRGFDDMQGRAAACHAFYEGAVWKEHRAEANATMIDFDDVLLLKPSKPGSGFRLKVGDRPAPAEDEVRGDMFAATIVPLAAGSEAAFADMFEAVLRPALEAAGAPVFASFATEKSPNNYPPLPLRSGANVFVWFAGFDDEAAHRDHVRRLSVLKAWKDGDAAAARLAAGGWQTLRLQPTARSLLRGAGSTMRR